VKNVFFLVFFLSVFSSCRQGSSNPDLTKEYCPDNIMFFNFHGYSLRAVADVRLYKYSKGSNWKSPLDSLNLTLMQVGKHFISSEQLYSEYEYKIYVWSTEQMYYLNNIKTQKKTCVNIFMPNNRDSYEAVVSYHLNGLPNVGWDMNFYNNTWGLKWSFINKRFRLAKDFLELKDYYPIAR